MMIKASEQSLCHAADASQFNPGPRRRKVHAGWIACFLIALVTGCSRFEKDWRAASDLNPSTVSSMAGRWQGTWKSDVNGHTDELRCLISPGTNNLHTARFHARYRRGIFRFSFGYTAALATTPSADGGHNFQGQADLGWYAGGVYRYEGRATETNFHSRYDSKYDRGIFEMRRPVTSSR